MTAVKEAIGAQTVPTNYTDINAIPVEQDIACRGASSLQFIGPAGLFTGVTKTKASATIRGVLVEVIGLDLTLNLKHAINPGGIVPGCNSDGVMALAALSSNVQGVADPIFIKNGGTPNRVTNVKLFFTRVNKNQPATLGIRAKYEENGGTGLKFDPRRISGTVTFP
jgi:hypothetical protein